MVIERKALNKIAGIICAIFIIITLISVVLMLSPNVLTKHYGGEYTIDLPQGRKAESVRDSGCKGREHRTGSNRPIRIRPAEQRKGYKKTARLFLRLCKRRMAGDGCCGYIF